MGRKKIGKEVRKVISLRIEPYKKEIVERFYNSLQEWFDLRLDEEFLTSEAVIIRKKKQEITVEDF